MKKELVFEIHNAGKKYFIYDDGSVDGFKGKTFIVNRHIPIRDRAYCLGRKAGETIERGKNENKG